MSLPTFKFKHSGYELRATSSSENRVCITPVKEDGTSGMVVGFHIPEEISKLESLVGKENSDRILSHFNMPR